MAIILLCNHQPREFSDHAINGAAGFEFEREVVVDKFFEEFWRVREYLHEPRAAELFVIGVHDVLKKIRDVGKRDR